MLQQRKLRTLLNLILCDNPGRLFMISCNLVFSDKVLELGTISTGYCTEKNKKAEQSSEAEVHKK